MHICTAIHQMAHGVRGSDPRSSRHSPSGAVLHRQAQAQPAALLRGMTHGILPQRTQTGNLWIHTRPLPTKLPMKKLYARDSSRSDRLQISSDPRQGHIATNVMKPGLRIINLFRLPESSTILLHKRTTQRLSIRYGCYLRRNPVSTTYQGRSHCPAYM